MLARHCSLLVKRNNFNIVICDQKEDAIEKSTSTTILWLDQKSCQQRNPIIEDLGALLVHHAIVVKAQLKNFGVPLSPNVRVIFIDSLRTKRKGVRAG